MVVSGFSVVSLLLSLLQSVQCIFIHKATMLSKSIDRSILRLYSFANCAPKTKNRTIIPAFRAYSQNAKRQYDIVVVGGGIVGMASAREILMRHPSLKVAVVEKEHKLAFHQSGHNSGVIHAGIYYKPGSLKAKLCVDGLHLSYKYFDEKNVPYKKVGKLIVATNEVEVGRLNDLYKRSLANNVPDVELVDAQRIKEIEPYCEGLKAIWSPHTGIVDWELVTQYYAKDFKQAGGDIHLNFEVSKFEETKDPDHPIVVKGKNNDVVESKYILTCGGLQSDKVAELTGCSSLPKIVPFRGSPSWAFISLHEWMAVFGWDLMRC